jgi:hypothetical protein
MTMWLSLSLVVFWDIHFRGVDSRNLRLERRARKPRGISFAILVFPISLRVEDPRVYHV